MSRILIVGRNGAGKTSSIESIKKNSNDNQIVAVQCRAIANYGNDSNNGVNKILKGDGGGASSDTNTAIGRAADRVNFVTRQVESVIRQYDLLGGFHAIIYVMKYGDSSINTLEKEVVEEVREILGKDVLHKHGIILMTNGEQFDMEHKDTPVTITEWCKQQKGDMVELFREVDDRIVLFNNKTDATNKITQQINGLVKFIQKINSNYGLAEFVMNSKGLEGLKVRILVEGREGNGSTSCINSINKVAANNNLLAVECRGIGDTGEDRRVDIQTVTRQVAKTVTIYDKLGGFKAKLGGFNAIVHLIKYGVRFTKQEKDAVQEVRRMFGKDVFRKFGIVVMTYGDLFDMDNEDDEKRTFIQWCKEQTGDIHSLFEEVNYRIVLFDNKTNDIKKLSDQLQNLMAYAADIKKSYDFGELDMSSLRLKEITLRILLEGREGNGTTSCIKTLKNVANENEVFAVQCRGIADTDGDRSKDIQVVTKDVDSVLLEYDHFGGFDAIAHVMKYGVRFTKQEKDAVEEVKRMFGEEVFRRNVIIIMTYGDLFDMDEGDMTFMQWCRQQTGDIHKLFEEVSYRIVLFDNKTKDPSRNKKQLQELKSCVYSINMQYRLSKFKTFSQRLRDVSSVTMSLLVIGRTGNGKKSVANTIVSLREGKLFPHVIENIGDSKDDRKCSRNEIFENVKTLVKKCKQDYDKVSAVLFVLKYGARFTKQEKDAVAMVKTIFGKKVFKKKVIMVFSYGDNFYLDNENSSKSFDGWCRDQTGELSKLFKEVKSRYILLDNTKKGRDENKNEESMYKLDDFIKKVEQLSIKVKRRSIFTKM